MYSEQGKWKTRKRLKNSPRILTIWQRSSTARIQKSAGSTIQISLITTKSEWSVTKNHSATCSTYRKWVSTLIQFYGRRARHIRSLVSVKQNAGSDKIHENVLLLFSTHQINARKQNKVVCHERFDLIIFIKSFDVFLIKVNSSVEIAEFRKEMADLANLYDWHLFKDEKLKRLFTRITDIGTAVQDDTTKLAKVGETMDVLHKTKINIKFTVLKYKHFRFFYTIRLFELRLLINVTKDRCQTMYILMK